MQGIDKNSKLRLIQWNIGGGRIRHPDADPTDTLSYREESIEYLAQLAMRYSPDIITLQETHQSPDGHNQAQRLASMIGFKFWVNDIHDESHIEREQLFGQAVLSRFPITGHNFQRLPNPDLATMSPEGLRLRSHNYGVTTVDINLPSGLVRVKTLHMPALHFFGVTPDMPQAKNVLNAVSQAIDTPDMPTLISGDYNLNTSSVLDFLPSLRDRGFRETPVSERTTPSGKQLDHVLHFGFESVATRVDDTALTDHFPLIADIEISKRCYTRT